MKSKLLILFLVLLQPSLLTAQEKVVEGRVTDAGDGTPLAFVHLVTPDGRYGTVTDVEGRFTLRLPRGACCLKVSCVGYAPVTYRIDPQKKVQQIRLHYRPLDIAAVTVRPGRNPAHRIIRLAVVRRRRNDPERLKEYSFISYNKMILTVDADTLLTCDTTLLDSTERAIRRLLRKQHFFISETVTRRIHRRPGTDQSVVLASRISGFRDPGMILLLSQLQEPTFYREQIHILGKDYVNPVSRGSTRKYVFLLEDTLIRAPGDTTYTISFRPRRNTSFAALEGFLSINSRGWAIENVQARPARDTGDIMVTIRQAYSRFDTVWFPVQLNTDLLFRTGAIEAGGRTYHPVARAVSYLRDIDLTPGLRKKDMAFDDVQVVPQAIRRDSAYWAHYRVRPLDSLERETYRVLDSIGRAEHLDRKARFLTTLLSGAIPAGPFDIDLERLMHYNDYEGFYLGAGLHTNDRVSKVVRAGGYGGYGFRDRSAKYGADVEVLLHPPSGTALRMAYDHTVFTEGGTSFPGMRRALLDVDHYSSFFVRRMNRTDRLALALRFRLKPLRRFRWDLSLERLRKEAYGNYMYLPFDAVDTTQVYHLTRISLSFRYAFRERVLHTTRSSFFLGSDSPVIHFRYTRGFRDLLGGDFSYGRYDLRVEGRVRTRYLGDLLWRTEGGLVSGHVPATELFIPMGTYRGFTLYTPYAFGTMRTNEFLADRYASLFLTWDLRDLLIRIRQWKPRPMLVTSLAFGNLSRPEDHRNITVSTFSKGYYESGVVVRRLLVSGLTDLGAGVLYRYGPYRLPHTKDNFAFRFSLYYSF